MDPVTATIVAAATFLGPEVIKEGVNAIVQDAYDALKAVIRRKWGGDSAVAQSVDALEKKPASKGLAVDLAEEVAKTGAARDAEVLRALTALTDALVKIDVQRPSKKAVNISGDNIGVANIDQVTGGTFNIGLPATKR